MMKSILSRLISRPFKKHRLLSFFFLICSLLASPSSVLSFSSCLGDQLGETNWQTEGLEFGEQLVESGHAVASCHRDFVMPHLNQLLVGLVMPPGVAAAPAWSWLATLVVATACAGGRNQWKKGIQWNEATGDSLASSPSSCECFLLCGGSSSRRRGSVFLLPSPSPLLLKFRSVNLS